MLSQKTINIVKSTVPVLEVHGLSITSTFYRNLFNKHPELKNLFNHQNQRGGRQPAALANAVYGAAKYIDNLSTILPTVMVIAHKHRSLGILPEHYPIVGTNLLEAIKEVLGDAATPDIIQAWGEAYGVIADVFIQVEEDLYKQAEANGGWRFFKDFKLVRKVEENELITSFYFAPADGKPLPKYVPGQYIGVRVKIPEEEFIMNRQYTISHFEQNPNEYRISVKREDESTPNGKVSTYLHKRVNVGDVIELSAPAGGFTLKDNSNPVVYMSGGIGVTPLHSMLQSMSPSSRKVTFLQAARNDNVIAFKESISNKVKELNGEHSIFYSDSGEKITSDILKNHTTDSEFYICGPIPFMEQAVQILKNLEVPNDRVHFEFFGPALQIV